VTCAIPGAKRPAQVAENIAASDLPAVVRSRDEKNPRDLRRRDSPASAIIIGERNRLAPLPGLR